MDNKTTTKNLPVQLEHQKKIIALLFKKTY